MKSSMIAEVLAPFNIMAVKNALTPVYTSILLFPGMLKGISPWGTLELDIELDIEFEAAVKASDFITAIQSYPDAELHLSVKDNFFFMRCGTSRDRLSLITDLGGLTTPDFSPLDENSMVATKLFREAVILGGLSCGPESTATAGIHGVNFKFRKDGIWVTSSDGMTLATCHIARKRPFVGWPKELTLRPEAARMLVTVLKFIDPESKPVIRFTEDACYLQSGNFRLFLSAAPPLKVDILDLAANYPGREVVSKIEVVEAIKYLRNVISSAESRAHAFVELSFDKGKLSMKYEEDEATQRGRIAEKKNLCPVDAPDGMPPVKLKADDMLRILEHSPRIAFDHIDREVLVFCGEKPTFDYYICGSKPGNE